MVAEKARAALEKRGATFHVVKPWMDFKRTQREALAGTLHVEETWIPGKDTPWNQDMHVTMFAPLDATKIKKLAICFHGLGNFGEREFYYLAPWLAERGHLVVLPDLPYFGHNVLHRGAHCRIGKWADQLRAMTAAISWAREQAACRVSTPAASSVLPWFVVGISMSGLGVLNWGLDHFNEHTFDAAAMDACKGIVALVPALQFRVEVPTVKKALAFLIGKLAPDFAFDQVGPVDPATGLLPVSHDLDSVQWCVPCIERGDMFGLQGVEGEREYQLDGFPASPLSTVSKLFLASKDTFSRAARWPRVPLFCTGSELDDMVDPSGPESFVVRVDPSIRTRYTLYEGFYHAQTGEKDRERVFGDILSFVSS